LQRIAWIDVARGLAIALVVLGHTHAGQESRLVYAFHMPAFFVLAGLTFDFRRHRDDFAGFARGKARRLLLPYFVSAALLYLVWLLAGRRFGDDPANAVDPRVPLAGILYGNGTDHWLVFNLALWFLPALFLAELLLWGVLRLAGRAGPGAEAALAAAAGVAGLGLGLAAVLPWGLDVALAAVPFLWAGYSARTRLEGSVHSPRFAARWGAAALVALAAAVLLNERVDMNNRVYGGPALFYLGGLGGSLLLLLLAGALSRWEAARAALSYLGRESLMVLVFHFLGMKVLSAFAALLLPTPDGDLWTRAWWGYLLAGLLVPLGVAGVIKRVPLLREVYYKAPSPPRAPSPAAPATASG
jgi:fucose 4-O-acetylase-like acetyltransferase